MRTATLRSLVLACFASAALLTTGCNRNNDATPSDDITTAEDRTEDNVETAISTDAFQISTPQDVNANASNATGFTTTETEFRAKFGPCVTRTYTASNHTLLIDFGSGCMCSDGRFRSGQIIVRFTTDVNRRIAGAVVRRRNYFVNYNQHIATRTFTDLGGGSFSVAVDSARIIRANNGGTHSWTANWTFVPNPNNTATVREYSVTGSSSGTNRNGVGYTATVQTPLVKSSTCFKYFTSGSVNISNSKGKTMLLDYGNGTCDNVATVTVNGHTRTIQLR